jgi:hypothetical protein
MRSLVGKSDTGACACIQSREMSGYSEKSGCDLSEVGGVVPCDNKFAET